MTYLLDSNVFIAAKNNYYGFDFCRAFWDWLDLANMTGTVASVERVYGELIEREDDLSKWAHDRQPFFQPLASADVTAVAAVNRWANDSPDYDPAAKTEFAAAADSFLVAQAFAGGHTVVTHERISDGRKRIKIPNAAAAHGVEWCTPFHVLRDDGVSTIERTGNRDGVGGAATVASFLAGELWEVHEAADTESKAPGIDLLATKDERWLAIEVKGYPNTTSDLAEIVQEVLVATDRYSEQTIRTEIVSRMCAEAPVHHATVYNDLERVHRGQYRRRGGV